MVDFCRLNIVFFDIQYLVPVLNLVLAAKIPIKIHKDPEICDLNDHQEQRM